MISVKPYPPFSRFLDTLLDPFMRLMSSAPGEIAQQTHVWNLRAITPDELAGLADDLMLTVIGSHTGPIKTYRGGLFHLPVLGGWKDYVVIEPDAYVGEWRIGFLRDDEYEKSSYISLIPLRGPVRMLKAPEGISVRFVGVDAQGAQIRLRRVDEGRVGDGKFPNTRLL